MREDRQEERERLLIKCLSYDRDVNGEERTYETLLLLKVRTNEVIDTERERKKRGEREMN